MRQSYLRFNERRASERTYLSLQREKTKIEIHALITGLDAERGREVESGHRIIAKLRY